MWTDRVIRRFWQIWAKILTLGTKNWPQASKKRGLPIEGGGSGPLKREQQLMCSLAPWDGRENNVIKSCHKKRVATEKVAIERVQDHPSAYSSNSTDGQDDRRSFIKWNIMNWLLVSLVEFTKYLTSKNWLFYLLLQHGLRSKFPWKVNCYFISGRIEGQDFHSILTQLWWCNFNMSSMIWIIILWLSHTSNFE